MHTNIVIVLHRPQQMRNIGAVVRAMKNMGLQRLRLVAPVEFVPDDLGGIAHRSEDVLAQLEICTSLDEALADAVFVVGTSARQRTRPGIDPQTLAPELLARAATGPVALLFGPEDQGLRAEELDRCHQVITIPTSAEYRSLNLAQAVLLVAYELLRATPHTTAPLPVTANLVTGAQRDVLFAELERMLWSIEFFKSGNAEPVMRSLRLLLARAEPDPRELALLMAICREVQHHARRASSDEHG